MPEKDLRALFRTNLVDLDAMQVFANRDGERSTFDRAYASIVIAYHRYRRHHLTHPDSAKQHLYQEIPDFVSSLSRRGGLAGISGM